MAGELVRDLNFTPGRAFTKIPHLYLLDFLNNQLQVETEVFAKEGGATAFFQVKIVGEITGDTFAVFDPARKREIFTFSLAEAGKPEFFELEFPFLAYHARLNSAEMTPNNTDLLVGQAISMELVVSVQQKGTRVCVHKEVGELFLNVRDVKTETDFMRLPAASLNNIAGLIIAIEEHLCGSPLESVVAPVNKS
jgi:hypothetical protein